MELKKIYELMSKFDEISHYKQDLYFILFSDGSGSYQIENGNVFYKQFRNFEKDGLEVLKEILNDERVYKVLK